MLRLPDLVLLIIGTVIGSGIFLVPGLVLKAVGNSLLVALSVWLVGGILSLLGALTYGELSAMNPAAGGLYVYIRDCFGRRPHSCLDGFSSSLSVQVRSRRLRLPSAITLQNWSLLRHGLRDLYRFR